MKLKRFFKRFVLIALTLSTILVGVLSWVVWKYEDRILQLFIEEANNYLTAEVSVGKIDLTFWENFPEIGIQMQNVLISDPLDKNTYFAKSEDIFFKLDLMALIQDRVEVESIYLNGAHVHFRINKRGDRNFMIFSEGKDTTSTKHSAQPFNIKNLTIKHSEITYDDQKNEVDFSVKVKSAVSIIHSKGSSLNIHNKGDYEVLNVHSREDAYYTNVPIQTNGRITLSDVGNYLSFEKFNLIYRNSKFDLTGGIDFRASVIKSLSIESEQTNLTTVAGLIPGIDRTFLNKYGSEGDLSLQGAFNGSFNNGKIPQFQFEVKCQHGQFYPKDYNVKLKDINFEATVHHQQGASIDRTSLDVNDFSASLDGQQIEGECAISDFKSYLGRGRIKGVVDLETLTKLIQHERLEKAYGKCELDINFEGALKETKRSNGRRNFSAGGEIILNNASFKLNKEPIAFNNLNGSFIFNDQDLAISNFSGMAGRSDFMIQGFFKDFVSYLFNESGIFNMSADLKSKYISLDELLSANFYDSGTSNSTSQPYSFHVPRNLNINFNCNIERVSLKRFHGANAKGHLVVGKQRAILEDVRMQTMGGELNISGTLNDQQPGRIAVLAEANLKGIFPDSVFYVFNNFNQNFITHKNLKGEVYADMVTYFELTNNLDFIGKSLESDIQVRVEKGALIDFEPMQKLNKYAEAEDLANLRFSNLVNRITIKDEVINLPEMEVMTNISYLTISGTHTFDQHIDYHVAVPVKTFIKFGRKHPEGFERARKGSKLLLQIVGTTDEYEILYDTQALKQKLKEDLKREGQELKNIFKRKGKKEEVIEVEEEEYFNFDQNN